MKLYKFVFVPFALFFAACGNDDGSNIDLNGKTPEQQADTVADATCSAILDCENVTFNIATDPETEEVTCTTEFEAGTQDDYDMCYEDFHANALSIFTDCELSDADLNTIEQCFNARLAQGCITQAQADATCDAFVAGEEDPDIAGHEDPAICADVDAIIEACPQPG